WDGGTIQPRPSADADRRAAEWVLSMGGKVRIQIGGKTQDVAASRDLPAGNFDLQWIDLANRAALTHQCLWQFAVLEPLTNIWLIGTSFGNAGLSHLKDLPELIYLDVSGSAVDDAGLQQLKSMRNLTGLYIGGLPVSDAGLEHMKNCPNLRGLSIA